MLPMLPMEMPFSISIGPLLLVLVNRPLYNYRGAVNISLGNHIRRARALMAADGKAMAIFDCVAVVERIIESRVAITVITGRSTDRNGI